MARLSNCAMARMMSRRSQPAKQVKSRARSPSRTERLGFRSAWAGHRHMPLSPRQVPPSLWTSLAATSARSGARMAVVIEQIYKKTKEHESTSSELDRSSSPFSSSCSHLGNPVRHLEDYPAQGRCKGNRKISGENRPVVREDRWQTNRHSQGATQRDDISRARARLLSIKSPYAQMARSSRSA
jgi:hypothetical protein